MDFKVRKRNCTINMHLHSFIFVIFCACACFGKNSKQCEKKQNLKDVRIPKGQLFTQAEFNNYVSGKTLKQAYILLPDPAPFNVALNYNCEITAVGASTYQRVCTGLEPNCVEYSLALSTVSQGNKVYFAYTDPSNNDLNEYYWSPSPSKFILRIQCPVVSLQQNKKCSKAGARITVFLVGDVNLSNAPWNCISKEIFTATGAKFGDVHGMNWFFTESTDTPCVS